MDLLERLKQLRKGILKLNQEEFGQRIGLSKSNISNIEVGRIKLTDRNLQDICREFNIDENWLRTGDGKMYIEKSEDEVMAEFAADLTLTDDEFIKNLVKQYLSLTEEDKGLVRKLFSFTK